MTAFTTHSAMYPRLGGLVCSPPKHIIAGSALPRRCVLELERFPAAGGNFHAEWRAKTPTGALIALFPVGVPEGPPEGGHYETSVPGGLL